MARVYSVLAASWMLGAVAIDAGAAALPRKLASSVERLKAVGPEGQGNAAAQAAWNEVPRLRPVRSRSCSWPWMGPMTMR